MNLSEYDNASETHSVPDIEIQRFYVQEVTQNSGISHFLMDKETEKAQNKVFNFMWLEVW